MPRFQDIAKPLVGRYLLGAGPEFGGSSPADGGTANISATGGFTSVFDADAINTKNYGTVTFSVLMLTQSIQKIMER